MFDNRLFNEFRRSVDQLFENFSHSGRRIGSESGADWTFTPAVEVGWTDDNLNLRVLVPGVTEKDLNVSVQGNQLSIRGERKAPKDFAKEGYYYSGLVYGKFERILDLPNGLDLDKMQAHLHDGVLDVRIPVRAEVKPKQIQITSGEQPKAIAA